MNPSELAWNYEGAIQPPVKIVDTADSATRRMVSSTAPKATIVLDDGAAPREVPLSTEVTPGKHVVRIEADGFLGERREIPVIPGAITAIDVALHAKPALDYNAAISARDGLRPATGALLGIGIASAGAGAALYFFDDRGAPSTSAQEPAAPKASPAPSGPVEISAAPAIGPGILGATLTGRFLDSLSRCLETGYLKALRATDSSPRLRGR